MRADEKSFHCPLNKDPELINFSLTLWLEEFVDQRIHLQFVFHHEMLMFGVILWKVYNNTIMVQINWYRQPVIVY